jgi:outer membrane protein assembly factor BamB
MFGGIVITICLTVLLPGCTGKALTETPPPVIEKPKPPTTIPMWLGNAERNFFGTGPLKDGELKVIWEVETSWTRGRLHPDPWGGSGWPGQAAIVGDRVYFGSADSYVYCLNKNDGSVIWKFKTTDSAKSSPCVVGNRLVIGNLDHTVYCLNTDDGSLVWKYQTGFETDSSSSIVDDRVYIGGEDHFYYCFDFSGRRNYGCRRSHLCKY